MNRFEEELLNYIKIRFKNELKNNIIELEISTPENAKKHGYTFKGWAVAITKRKVKDNKRDIRVVIWSPDLELLSELDDYQIIFKKITELAKQIIDNPPFPQYISQGIIRTTFEGQYVEFISKDELRKLN